MIFWFTLSLARFLENIFSNLILFSRCCVFFRATVPRANHVMVVFNVWLNHSTMGFWAMVFSFHRWYNAICRKQYYVLWLAVVAPNFYIYFPLLLKTLLLFCFCRRENASTVHVWLCKCVWVFYFVSFLCTTAIAFDSSSYSCEWENMWGENVRQQNNTRSPL